MKKDLRSAEESSPCMRLWCHVSDGVLAHTKITKLKYRKWPLICYENLKRCEVQNVTCGYLTTFESRNGYDLV
jgi:hypothetical protein